MEEICKVFDKYVSNYDLNNKDIKLKYNHSYRVMKLSEKYARLLGYSEDDIKLATIIGLFHDIGRFEQLRIYNTYYDKDSIDHADFGVKILFEDGLIKQIYTKEEDYEIIKFAIQNHNKYKIPNTKNKRSLMHAKLIRDTDKLDIVYLGGFLDELKTRSNNEEISKEIVNHFINHENVPYDFIKNKNDSITIRFAYAFDINNSICLPELKQNYERYYKTVCVTDKLKDIYEETIKYIDERIDEDVR